MLRVPQYPRLANQVLLGAGVWAEPLPQELSDVRFVSSEQGVPVLPHEPLVEPLEDQAEATQADLFDSLVEAESEEYGQLLSGGAVSAASAGVANSGGTAHPTAPADGPADQAQIASERQANESIGYYESAKPMGQTEEAMPQAELPHSTGPPPAA